jgi:ElaB/YqjD/DUF883 family membrane-anchored ribosome-binding protein
MTTANASSFGEQLRSNFTGAVDKAKEISEGIRDHVDSSYRAIGRGIKEVKAGTEDAVKKTRHAIKERPLTTVATVGIAGFALGLLAGWVIAKRRS